MKEKGEGESPDVILINKCDTNRESYNNTPKSALTKEKNVKDIIPVISNVHIYSNHKQYHHLVMKSSFEEPHIAIYVVSSIICLLHCAVCLLFLFYSPVKYIQISSNVAVCLLSLYYNKNIASRRLVGIRWWSSVYLMDGEKPNTCLEVRGARKNIKKSNKLLFVIFNMLPVACYFLQILYNFFAFGIFSVVKLIETLFFVVLSMVNPTMCCMSRLVHLHFIAKKRRKERLDKRKISQ